MNFNISLPKKSTKSTKEDSNEEMREKGGIKQREKKQKTEVRFFLNH